ncbi:hypothetical protein NGA_0699200, partial [Nannochloropsis gaditana CCMP526]|uniref:uncharacterized protein n=1 Tax=Nannochloropsis gaditana (strain CCMP526) TaxID=1093141 RepID=UPI00029F7D37
GGAGVAADPDGEEFRPRGLRDYRPSLEPHPCHQARALAPCARLLERPPGACID